MYFIEVIKRRNSAGSLSSDTAGGGDTRPDKGHDSRPTKRAQGLVGVEQSVDTQLKHGIFAIRGRHATTYRFRKKQLFDSSKPLRAH